MSIGKPKQRVDYKSLSWWGLPTNDNDKSISDFVYEWQLILNIDNNPFWAPYDKHISQSSGGSYIFTMSETRKTLKLTYRLGYVIPHLSNHQS